MDVTLALLADAANVTQDGKLNIMGIFNALAAASYPVAHPQMHLVMRFEAPRAEEGKTRKVEIQLADGDGRRLFTVATTLLVPVGFPGAPIRMNHILALNNIRFERPGDYVFNVLIGDDLKAAVDLKLVEAKREERAPRA